MVLRPEVEQRDVTRHWVTSWVHETGPPSAAYGATWACLLSSAKGLKPLCVDGRAHEYGMIQPAIDLSSWCNIGSGRYLSCSNLRR